MTQHPIAGLLLAVSAVMTTACGNEVAGDQSSDLLAEPAPLTAASIELRWQERTVTATHGMVVPAASSYPEGWLRFVFSDTAIGCETDLMHEYNTGSDGALFSYFVLEPPLPASGIESLIEVLARGDDEKVAHGTVTIESFDDVTTSGEFDLDEADFGASGTFSDLRVCP